MKKDGQFIKESLDMSSSNFSKMFTRIEYSSNNSNMYKYIEYTQSDFEDKRMFKKNTFGTYINKQHRVPSDINYSEGKTTINYKGKPVLNLMTVRSYYHNYGGFRSPMTHVDTYVKFAIYTKICFDGNIDKSINFFNKRFLSANRLEINTVLMLKEYSKLENNSIDSLLSMVFYDFEHRGSDFKSLDFTKERSPNKKSNKDASLKLKTNNFIKGLNMHMNHYFKEFERELEYDNIIRIRISKKSNPIRIVVGMNREIFSNSRNYILSSEFFNNYKSAKEKLLNFYKNLDLISLDKTKNSADSHDSFSFTIDINKISDKGKASDFYKAILSGATISKFNL